ncbi:MAG: hypothetical protein LBL13_06380, partial [Bacteroidales bacterium]|nr:hypothetical protein [Bacteroidales bacterium]
IDTAADEGAKRRCPFLFNILEAIGIITQTTREIEINCFVISNQTIMLKNKESDFSERINKLYDSLCKKIDVSFSNEEISLLKEAFGKEFMTEKYYLNNFVKLITDKTLYVFFEEHDYTFKRLAA